jgi:hypothetical protein
MVRNPRKLIEEDLLQPTGGFKPKGKTSLGIAINQILGL